MKLKYFMRGIGVGIVITTLILSLTQDKIEKVEMTENEIIDAAKELGMVMSESVHIDYESIRNTLNQQEDVPKDSSDVEDDGNSNSNQVNEDDNGSGVSGEESDTDSDISTDGDSGLDKEVENGNIEIGASDDGLTDQNNTSSNESSTNTESDSNTKESDTDTNQSDDTDLGTNETDLIQNQGDYAIITVELGMYSSDVSELLEKANVIENSKEFNKFLSYNGYSTLLIAGKHKIPYDATYQEIAELLMDKNK